MKKLLIGIALTLTSLFGFGQTHMDTIQSNYVTHRTLLYTREGKLGGGTPIVIDSLDWFNVYSPNRNEVRLRTIGYDTDADSIRILYKTGSYPSSRTNGTLFAAFGDADTTDYHDTTFTYTAATDDVMLYWRAYFARNNSWSSNFNQDTCIVDSIADPETPPLEGTNYYLDPVDGNDSNDGSTELLAWKTFAPVRTLLPNADPATNILIKKGTTLRDTISLASVYGASNGYITISSYGSGTNPIISGGMLVTSSWTNRGGNIYTTKLNLPYDASNVYFLKINGRQQTVGRHPNGFRDTLTRVINNTNIIDSIGRKTTDDYWNGATIWLTCYDWIRTTSVVQDYAGSNGQFTVSPALSGGYAANNFYVLSNHVNCLDQNGEWAYNAANDTLYYYCTGSPTLGDSTIEVSSRRTLVNLAQNNSHIKFLNVDFDMSNMYGIHTDSCNNVIVDGCTISRAVVGFDGYTLRRSTIKNSTIQNCHRDGICLTNTADITIKDNTIRYIADKMGVYNLSQAGRGISLVERWTGSGSIYVGCDSTFIHRNNIYNIGSSGINFNRCNKTYVDSNRVVNASLYLSDYGPIYFVNCAPKSNWWNPERWYGSHPWVGNFVRNNYIDITDTTLYDNVRPRTTSSATGLALYGIYADNYSRDATVSGNVINCRKKLFSGIFMHLTDSITVSNNIVTQHHNESQTDPKCCMLQTGDRGIMMSYTGNKTVFLGYGQSYGKGNNFRMFTNMVNSVVNNNYFLYPRANEYGGYSIFYQYKSADPRIGSRGYDDVSEMQTALTEGPTSTGNHDDPFKYPASGLTTADSMYFVYYNFSGSTVHLNTLRRTHQVFYDLDNNLVTDDEILPYTGVIYACKRGDY